MMPHIYLIYSYTPLQTIITDMLHPDPRKRPDATTLEQVEVRAEKSRMQMSLDKRVFNVGKDLANLGGSATDVLDNVPSVTVDVEGNVSLRGSGGVRILINGRPSSLVGVGDTDGLRNIPANLIERVEVIRGPASTLYGADAIGGVINIITKKHDGYVSAQVGHFNKTGVTLKATHEQKAFKWNTYLHAQKDDGDEYQIADSFSDNMIVSDDPKSLVEFHTHVDIYNTQISFYAHQVTGENFYTLGLLSNGFNLNKDSFKKSVYSNLLEIK